MDIRPLLNPDRRDFERLLDQIEENAARIVRQQHEEMRLAELERRAGCEEPDYE